MLPIRRDNLKRFISNRQRHGNLAYMEKSKLAIENFQETLDVVSEGDIVRTFNELPSPPYLQKILPIFLDVCLTKINGQIHIDNEKFIFLMNFIVSVGSYDIFDENNQLQKWILLDYLKMKKDFNEEEIQNFASNPVVKKAIFSSYLTNIALAILADHCKKSNKYKTKQGPITTVIKDNDGEDVEYPDLAGLMTTLQTRWLDSNLQSANFDNLILSNQNTYSLLFKLTIGSLNEEIACLKDNSVHVDDAATQSFICSLEELRNDLQTSLEQQRDGKRTLKKIINSPAVKIAIETTSMLRQLRTLPNDEMSKKEKTDSVLTYLDNCQKISNQFGKTIIKVATCAVCFIREIFVGVDEALAYVKPNLYVATPQSMRLLNHPAMGTKTHATTNITTDIFMGFLNNMFFRYDKKAELNKNTRNVSECAANYLAERSRTEKQDDASMKQDDGSIKPYTIK
jgi:hypothetical protein